jgi:uncharacterized protein
MNKADASAILANAPAPPFDPTRFVAKDLGLPAAGVSAVTHLVAGGATIPFIARYRKEATGGLDEVQIRDIAERHAYLTELEARRATILEEIGKQGKLTDNLLQKIRAATQKAELEDLYVPFKPKRRNRAMMARERGLQPLANRILLQPLDGSPEGEARAFVGTEMGVPGDKEALQGARDIAAEACAETTEVLSFCRRLFLDHGMVTVEKAVSTEGPTKFEAYYGFREAGKTIPSHRYLAVRRGEVENVLKVSLVVDQTRALDEICRVMKRNPRSPFCAQLEEAIQDAWKRLLAPGIETDVRAELKLRADRQAVEVFAQNLRSLLLAPPLGNQAVMGIDPGQRTGCKIAVVDATGKLLDHAVLYLVQGEDALRRSQRTLRDLLVRHKPVAVAVGNGTHGRETERFVRDALKNSDHQATFSVMVNEAGASVYSASDVARAEFPDLDLTVRGAISIARRLQDPLAELVKVDPKSIGVGQYQHDVFQPMLSTKLDDVVESCVNAVGVDLNTASAPLLGYVAGIGPILAKRIVEFRNGKGPFSSRATLREVGGLGPKTFEQCAGFLRIRGGTHPLDASAVHPERYGLVGRMAADLGVEVARMVGDDALISRIDWHRYLSADAGEPTLKDILDELRKPGRDPRQVFEAPAFRDDVTTMEHLKSGMWLEGVVTNVTAFGAFVDVGVHQDGLVHVSQLADRFVKDPSEVVKAGDGLKVRVLEVDLVRKRISLTARTGEGPPPRVLGRKGPEGPPSTAKTPDRKADAQRAPPSFSNKPFAQLLKK